VSVGLLFTTVMLMMIFSLWKGFEILSKIDDQNIRMPTKEEVGMFTDIPATCPVNMHQFDLMSNDPYRLYKIDDRVLAPLPSPFRCGAIHSTTKLFVPFPGWSQSKTKYKFGGFTADMGWNLMVARYVLQGRAGTSASVEFFGRWGHGCEGEENLGWHCMFQEITPLNCLAANYSVHQLDYKDSPTRRTVKMYDLYDSQSEEFGHRNRFIFNLAGVYDGIKGSGDIQMWRLLFKWIYKLTDFARHKVDVLKRKMIPTPRRYIAFHIRWGDKVGRGGGPKESSVVPLEDYIRSIACYYESISVATIPLDVFVATDDYEAFKQIKILMGPKFRVFTSATPARKGFSIDDYNLMKESRAKFSESIHLWSDLEILADSEVFVANLESNIGKMVHLMRNEKHPSSTMNAMDVKQGGKSCCVDKVMKNKNCMWFCT